MEPTPRLRQDLISSEQSNDKQGKIVLLKDPVSDEHYMLNWKEFRLLDLLDGKTTLEAATFKARSMGLYFTVEQAQALVTKAAQNGLVITDDRATRANLRSVKEQEKRAQEGRIFTSVYFLFIPLVNPDRFLEKTLWLVRPFWNGFSKTLITLLAPVSVFLVYTGWDRLDPERLFFFNLENLVYLWITIAITKLIHELAHAYTAKSFGLRIPRMGLAMLIFFPCLYCDTTDAWRIAQKDKRIAISAAGIISEAVLAIISVFIWRFTQPGLINSLAFYLMSISFISTVMFNGNPLLKFDGYFILADYLEIPNLQSRSFNFVKGLFYEYVLGIQKMWNRAKSIREAFIYGFYGISSFLYRVFLYVSIVVGVYYRFDKVLGLCLAVFAFALFVVRPVAGSFVWLASNMEHISLRPKGIIFLVALALLLFMCLTTPVSKKTVFPCFVESQKKQKITVPLDANIREVFIGEGQPAIRGAALFNMDYSKLQLKMEKTLIDIEILEQEISQMEADQTRLGDLGAKIIELSQLKNRLRLINEKLYIGKNGVIAAFDGIVTELDQRLSEGYRPGKGAVVGELKSNKQMEVLALVREKDLHRVKQGEKALAWFPIKTGLEIEVKISKIRPFNKSSLRDSPFSSKYGGEIATAEDPMGDDAPLEAQYLCEAEIVEPRKLPLGLCGKLIVESEPRSLSGRARDSIAQTLNVELLF